jgi:hypothetical protein
VSEADRNGKQNSKELTYMYPTFFSLNVWENSDVLCKEFSTDPARRIGVRIYSESLIYRSKTVLQDKISRGQLKIKEYM